MGSLGVTWPGLHRGKVTSGARLGTPLMPGPGRMSGTCLAGRHVGWTGDGPSPVLCRVEGHAVSWVLK